MLCLTDEESLFLKNIKDIAKREIQPSMPTNEDLIVLPEKTLKIMRLIGLFGLLIPKQYKGIGSSYFLYYLVIKEISKICTSHALTLLSHTLCTYIINEFGNEDQKRKYLPLMASGDIIGCVCMTEPDAGSDLDAIKTRADQQNDCFILNGNKHFITNGSTASLFIVLAKTSQGNNFFDKSLFIIDNENKQGVNSGKRENKMGFKGADTSQIFFSNVKLPLTNLLGKLGQGSLLISQAMMCSRIATASIALGIAELAYTITTKYLKNKPVNNLKDISLFVLAEIATDLKCCELMIFHGAELQASEKQITKHAAMTKYFVTEKAFQIVSNLMDLIGEDAYISKNRIERCYRDVRLCKIIEGTNEIQKLIISNYL